MVRVKVNTIGNIFLPLVRMWYTRDMESSELTTWRERLGLTREDLAQALKTTYTTVYRWETGDRAIPPFLERAIRDLERELEQKKK